MPLILCIFTTYAFYILLLVPLTLYNFATYIILHNLNFCIFATYIGSSVPLFCVFSLHRSIGCCKNLPRARYLFKPAEILLARTPEVLFFIARNLLDVIDNG